MRQNKKSILLLLLCCLGLMVRGQSGGNLLGEAGVSTARLTAPAPSGGGAPLVLRTAPTSPTSRTPADGAKAVPRGSTVVVDFSGPIQPSSVSGTTFVVQGESSGRHAGTFAFSNGNSQLTFQPTTAFAPGELVNVYVTDGILDQNGLGVLPWASKFWVGVTATEGFFGNRQEIQMGTLPFTVKPYDMNGDGWMDFVTLLNVQGILESRAEIYLNDGNGNFNGPTVASLDLTNYGCGHAYGMDVGDLNGDGKGDIAAPVLGGTCTHIAVMLNDGNGNFPTVDRYPVGPAPDQLSMEDFNGDGHLDLVASGGGIAFLGTAQVMVLLNNGNGTFAPSIAYTTNSRTFGVAHADIDDDGDADLLTGNSSAFNFSVILNDGYGVFGAPTHYAAGTLPRDILALDLNGDNLEDVVVSNQTNVDPGSVTVYFNQGNGTFGQRQDYPTNGLPVGLGAADIDGDGDLDFASANHFGGAQYSYRSISLFVNNGGTFSRTDYDMGGFQPFDVNFADFNNDGAVEIISCAGNGKVSILYNLAPNVMGHVFVDDDNDCQWNHTSEFPLPAALVRAADEGGAEYYTYTNSAGRYALSLPPNHTYEVSLANRQGFDVACSYGVGDHFLKTVTTTTVATTGDEIPEHGGQCGATLGGYLTLNPFCNQPACVHGPQRTPCPCEQFTYTLQINNTHNSAIPVNTVISLSLPPEVRLCSTTPVSNSIPVTLTYTGGAPMSTANCPTNTCNTANLFGGTVTFTTGAPILGNSSTSIMISLVTADVPANCQPLDFVATWVDWAGNPNCLDDAIGHTYSDALCCSYDPNDKKVAPTDAQCAPIDPAEPLYYNVRFQNLGSAPAYKVVVRDELDADLDMQSFRSLATSHALTDLRILPGNIVQWTFDGIMLADAATNLAGSMGYISYMAYAKPDAAPGAVITNQASIYFDANPAVITNTTVSQLEGDDDFPAGFDWEQTFNCRWNMNPYSYHFFATDAPDGADFQWTFGPDANVSTANYSDVWLDFAGSGQKTVTLTVTVGHCSYSKTMSFQANGNVPICHKALEPGSGSGNQPLRYNYVTLYVPMNAVATHLRHGDECGPCYGSKTSEEAISSLGLGLAPNPASDRVTLQFNVSTPSDLQIRLIDQLGREVKQVFQGHCDAEGQLDLDVSQLPRGVYFVELSDGTQRVTQKLVTVR